ncbi:MAG TPA: rhomboid family intramembrane serine protease, partial [Gaiellaceae bacterium]|nr:rhomboid family intramembrane serine protease [Gaiellaceae bacterium]
WLTALLVVANVGFWLAYQLPHGLESSVDEVGFRACALGGDCREETTAWPLTASVSMFAHGGWAHLAGNMLFLLAFGVRVEDRLGRLRYLVLYLVAGYAATALQAAVELAWMSEDYQNLPGIGASGAISGVLGAYLVLFPFSRVVTILLPVFFLRVPALALLAVWFALQALEGTYGLAHPEEELAGIAFFAHVGGFVAGAAGATALAPESWPRAPFRARSLPEAPHMG